MSRRKPIDPSILEAAKQFDAREFADAVRGACKDYMRKWFLKLPDQLRNQLLALDGKRFRPAHFLGKITRVVELFSAEDRLCLAVEKSTPPAIFGQVDVLGAILSAREMECNKKT